MGPMMWLVTVLSFGPMMAVFRYGRETRSPLSTNISFQAWVEGWKSTYMRYLGPVFTSTGSLKAVTKSQ